MTILVSYDVDTREVDRWFAYAGYKARRGFADEFRVIKERIKNDAFLQFATEGGHLSGGWAPLAESTLDDKFRDGFALAILHRTMQLRFAMTDDGAFDVGPFHLAYGPSRLAEDGTDLVEVHSLGRPPGGRGGAMPARPPWEVTERFTEFIENRFEEWLDDLRTANSRRRGPGMRPSFPAPSFNLLD